MTELAEWESFYIIVGPSAGALIGLQFVVLTLIGERPMMRVDGEMRHVEGYDPLSGEQVMRMLLAITPDHPVFHID